MPRKNKVKTSSFRWKKIIIVFLVVTGIAIPLVLLSINWNNLSVLYATGSSSVFPLMKSLSQTYQQNRGSSKSIDVTVESTGSGSGLEKILANKTSFGNISYSPDVEKVSENESAWSAGKIKTISLGIDGIALVYKADVNLDINQNNIDDIYLAFSGVEKKTYADLGASGPDANKDLIPFARTGGKNKSGTTEAFMKNSGFNIDNSNPNVKDAMNRLNSGNYGPNSIETTKESQTESWNQILSFNKTGSIVYLATGFVLQNYDTILNSGYKIATYNGNSLSKENIQNGSYNWTRFLNTLVSLKTDNKDVKTWIDWIFANYDKSYVQESFASVGIIQLSQEQINSMKKDNNFWVDDFTIMPLAEAEKETNYMYGAQK